MLAVSGEQERHFERAGISAFLALLGKRSVLMDPWCGPNLSACFWIAIDKSDPGLPKYVTLPSSILTNISADAIAWTQGCNLSSMGVRLVTAFNSTCNKGTCPFHDYFLFVQAASFLCKNNARKLIRRGHVALDDNTHVSKWKARSGSRRYRCAR